MPEAVWEALAPAIPPRPRLRGVVHGALLPLAVAAAIVLVWLAPTPEVRIAAAVYGAAVCLMLTASATYHLRAWSERPHRHLERLDHAGIYLAIAGTYTPFGLIALDGSRSTALIAVVWTGALSGVGLVGLGAPRWARTAIYLLLGWVAAWFLPELMRGGGVAAVTLAIVGGGLYSAGALVYALRRPDPAPAVFGFHELFHALVAAAFVTHYVAVSLLVYPAG